MKKCFLDKAGFVMSGLMGLVFVLVFYLITGINITYVSPSVTVSLWFFMSVIAACTADSILKRRYRKCGGNIIHFQEYKKVSKAV